MGVGVCRVGSIKWSTKAIENQRSHLGYHLTFLVLTIYQAKDERHQPTLCGLSIPLNTILRYSHDQPMVLSITLGVNRV